MLIMIRRKISQYNKITYQLPTQKLLNFNCFQIQNASYKLQFIKLDKQSYPLHHHLNFKSHIIIQIQYTRLMTTSLQKQPYSHTDGPLESIYKIAKNYLPKFSQNQILTTVDTQLLRSIEFCDKVVLSTSKTIQNNFKKIPLTKDISVFLHTTSEKALIRTEKLLDSTIQILGGDVEEIKEGPEEIVVRFVNIFTKLIQANFLLMKNTANRAIFYTQQPKALTKDIKIWINKFYMETSAVSIVMKQLFIDTTLQFLGGLGSRYIQTKNKIKVLLTNITDPQKAYILLSERLIDIKNVTVKRVEEGIEIIMDRQHYYDNLKKLASSLLDVIHTISAKADGMIETSSSFTKGLYEKIVRNYKIQKILLEKSPTQITH